MVLFIPCGTVNKGFHQSVKYYLQEYFTYIRTHTHNVEGIVRGTSRKKYKGLQEGEKKVSIKFRNSNRRF